MESFLIKQENIGAILFDPKSLNISEVNHRAGEILGKSNETLIGKYLNLVFPLDETILTKLKTTHIKKYRTLDEKIVFLQEDKPLMSMLFRYDHRFALLFFPIPDVSDRMSKLFILQLRFFMPDLKFFGIMIDLNGNIKYCSKVFCKLTGYMPENLMNKNFFDIFIDSSRAEFYKSQFALLLGNDHIPQTLQIEIKDKNGQFIEMLWNAKFIYDSAGKIIGVSGIGIDLPYLKVQSQKSGRRGKLESVIAQISSMFAQAPSYKVDETINKALEIVGKYASVDRCYVFLFRDNQQLMDNTHEWCAPGIEPQIDNLIGVPSKLVPWWMKRLLKHEIIHIPRVSELPPEANSEKEILEAQDILSLIVVPMLDNEELVGFIGFDSVRAPKFWSKEDINLLRIVSSIFVSSLKRKATGLSLADSERKYRTLFKAAPDLIFILNDKGEITSLNPAFKTITRQEVEKWLGKPFKELIFDDDQAIFDLHFHTCLDGNIPAPFEIKLKAPTDYRIAEIICSPLIERGIRKGIYGIARDITERRILEENLRHAERMKSIGVLAGGIAHDFNNILGILLGNYALLKEIAKDQEELQLPLDSIKQAIERGKNLIQNLLTFARKKEPKYEILDLNEEIKHITTLLRQTTPKSIYFDLKLSTEHPYIYSDQVQIHQVLINLCLNAIDAIHSEKNHGVIRISTIIEDSSSRSAQLNSDLKNPVVHLSVADDGIGMTDEQKKFIFDPFYTTKENGTGLGLAVVFGVIKSMNGRIEVESTLHHGTTFHLFFPLAKRDKQNVVKKPSRKRTVKVMNANIFVVEDDALLSQMLNYILKRHQYSVMQAYSGTEAIEKFSVINNKIDLVILDYDLPEKDGFEVARSLRKKDPYVKILMTSGYVEPDVRQKLEQLENIAFIEKPYDPEELLQRIPEILKNGEE